MHIRTITALLASFFLITSCSRSKKEKFKQLVNELDVISFGYFYSSDSLPDNFKESNPKIDTVFFGQEQVSGPMYELLGYYKRTDTLVHILSIEMGDFYQYLMISTFNQNGDLLNRVTPSFDGCTSIPDEFDSCKEKIEILNDSQILAKEYKLFKGVKGNDSTIITTNKFILTKNGELIKMNNW